MERAVEYRLVSDGRPKAGQAARCAYSALRIRLNELPKCRLACVPRYASPRDFRHIWEENHVQDSR